MRLVKRLDTFILKAYLQLFAGTFFVCLFVFLMQFTWRYTDELIGKGLSTEVLVQFFWYASLTLVPVSLPLALLLASLITFGNLGEKLELLAMKAAGIPLLRILLPVFFFALLVCGVSFHFQNSVGPEATKQLGSLVWSMKQKSPELQIPVGQFYSEIPGYNLYVEQKDTRTGMLYGVMIYTNTGSYQESEIVLADSARLQSTADKKYLQLTLYHGERFRNMDAKSGNMMKASVPYMRETFHQEVTLIGFDANFSQMDAGLFAGDARTKSLASTQRGIDSLNHRIDSTGRALYETQLLQGMQRKRPQAQPATHAPTRPLKTDVTGKARTAQDEADEPFDTLYQHLTPEQKQAAMRTAQSRVKQLKAEYEFRSLISEEDNHALRMHYVEKHKKFTLAISCLVFFFIGAPLGAIIRKGGLGVPVIVSVLIFIFYYVVNVSGEKMAKTGQWDILFGVWLSTMVLAPIGAFLTVQANRDSVVFNLEGYRMFFMRLLGLRSTRKLNRKEVIIHDPDYPTLAAQLDLLRTDCADYASRHRLMRVPNYWLIFFHYSNDTAVASISERMEELVQQLHNSRDTQVLNLLNQLPILSVSAHKRPFGSPRSNVAAGLLLPVGLVFYLRIWRYRIRLRRDMDTIQRLAAQLITRIQHITPKT